MIDVLGNDSDANAGDVLRLDTWVVEAGNGVVTQQVAGKLTYTPFPDFNGTDTFTYNITDGRDTSMMSATVTVTVNPVNDAPVAFNDAFAFMHGNNPMDPATITFGSGSVLGNDFDPDGGMQQKVVYDVDTTGTVGTIAMTSFTGEFTWSGPKNYIGTTAFRYRAADAGGLVSDWATVKLLGERHAPDESADEPAADEPAADEPAPADARGESRRIRGRGSAGDGERDDERHRRDGGRAAVRSDVRSGHRVRIRRDRDLRPLAGYADGGLVQLPLVRSEWDVVVGRHGHGGRRNADYLQRQWRCPRIQQG